MELKLGKTYNVDNFLDIVYPSWFYPGVDSVDRLLGMKSYGELHGFAFTLYPGLTSQSPLLATESSDPMALVIHIPQVVSGDSLFGVIRDHFQISEQMESRASNPVGSVPMTRFILSVVRPVKTSFSNHMDGFFPNFEVDVRKYVLEAAGFLFSGPLHISYGSSLIAFSREVLSLPSVHYETGLSDFETATDSVFIGSDLVHDVLVREALTKPVVVVDNGIDTEEIMATANKTLPLALFAVAGFVVVKLFSEKKEAEAHV